MIPAGCFQLLTGRDTMNVLRDDLVSPEISLLDKTRIRAQVPRIGTPRAAAGVRKRQGRHDRETGLARLSRQLFARFLARGSSSSGRKWGTVRSGETRQPRLLTPLLKPLCSPASASRREGRRCSRSSSTACALAVWPLLISATSSVSLITSRWAWLPPRQTTSAAAGSRIHTQSAWSPR